MVLSQHFGNIDLESFEIKGAAQVTFEEFADVKHVDGKPNCMSIDGLQNSLRRLHVDKAVADLTQEFKVVDLNGDGEIDFDEFQFAVKIRHGFGFEKNQYFISWTSAETISEKKMEEIGKMFAKELPHALRGKVHEVRAQRSLLPSLSFKGKSLETGLDVHSFSRVPTDELQEQMISRAATLADEPVQVKNVGA